MIGLLQRVSRASVTVAGRVTGRIDSGLLVFVGVHRDDGETEIARLAERILGYRVFPDGAGRMNLSVCDIQGGLLLVPQFTLAADTRKGTRASFTRAAEPGRASSYFDALVEKARLSLKTVQTGEFGATMEVELVNAGPVTVWLET